MEPTRRPRLNSFGFVAGLVVALAATPCHVDAFCNDLVAAAQREQRGEAHGLPPAFASALGLTGNWVTDEQRLQQAFIQSVTSALAESFQSGDSAYLHARQAIQNGVQVFRFRNGESNAPTDLQFDYYATPDPTAAPLGHAFYHGGDAVRFHIINEERGRMLLIQANGPSLRVVGWVGTTVVPATI